MEIQVIQNFFSILYASYWQKTRKPTIHLSKLSNRGLFGMRHISIPSEFSDMLNAFFPFSYFRMLIYLSICSSVHNNTQNQDILNGMDTEFSPPNDFALKNPVIVSNVFSRKGITS